MGKFYNAGEEKSSAVLVTHSEASLAKEMRCVNIRASTCYAIFEKKVIEAEETFHELLTNACGLSLGFFAQVIELFGISDAPRRL